MNIGIIGAGSIGAHAALLCANSGDNVTISNSHGPETIEALVADIGPRARVPRPSRR